MGEKTIFISLHSRVKFKNFIFSNVELTKDQQDIYTDKSMFQDSRVQVSLFKSVNDTSPAFMFSSLRHLSLQP